VKKHSTEEQAKMVRISNPLAESRLVVVSSDVQLVNSCKELESLLDKPGQACSLSCWTWGKLYGKSSATPRLCDLLRDGSDVLVVES
jgi:hypothetical protein